MQQVTPGQPQRQDQLPLPSEVAPGIWKITLPIPFPLKTVNMYALLSNDGWALIDAGIGVPDARAALSAALEFLDLDIANLRVLVLSHAHPDHIGLSAELQEQSGATVYMHPIDAASMQFIWGDKRPERFAAVSHFFKQHGMSESNPWFAQARPEDMQWIIRVPDHQQVTLVEDGQYINLLGEQYRVIWTPGHSDGHICLFRERDGVFIAADHVLPRITPNVGLYSAYDRVNPLGDYLDSLRKVAALPSSIVLPGHGEPFPDLAGRVQEIIEHHDQREREILSLLYQRPQHAYELAAQLFGNRLKNNDAQRMAVAETLAHLEYMRYAGQVEQRKTADEVILYTPV